MANYYAIIRTNYFSVTDEAKFREIIGSCGAAEDEIQVFEEMASDGTKQFGFGCYGTICGIPTGEDEDDEPDLDAFYDALQSVLVEDNAIMITEVGFEKLRYLIGHCTVITKHEIQGINIRDKAIELARSILGNPDFTTKMEY